MTTQPLLAPATDDLRRQLDRYDWSGQSASRRRILEAFLRLAINHGFTSVSMRMIGAEVNLKAPSVYAHFPDGRDEIVADSLRWHFYQFGSALLEEVDKCDTADDYWDVMVRVHLTRQLQLPQNVLMDLLIATDKMAQFLSDDIRREIHDLIDLHEAMYRAAASELGVKAPAEPVRVVCTLLENATRWCQWSGFEADLPALADRAVALTRSILDQSR